MANSADFPQIMFGSWLQFACLRTCFYQITPANSPVMFGRFFAISSDVSCLPHVGPVTNYHLTQFSELSHFQEKVIPEEDEEEAEEIRVTREPSNTNGGPYDSAIQGYKSFAKSALNNGSSSDSNPVTSDRSSPASSLSHSASTSSMSPAPSSSRPSVEATKSDAAVTVDAWEEKIETFVQPARRVSAEISNKMREKLANFEESKSDKEQTPVRLIEPDNSFRDKLKAFKTIESVASESRETPISGTLGSKPTRRESEPILTKPKGMPSYRSTSSSFMNTFQNNKFFQQVTNS